MSYRKGLLSVVQRTLFVHPSPPTSLSLPPLLLRGPGYRLPPSSQFAPLSGDPAGAEEIAAAVELFYSGVPQGSAPSAVCFGGGLCDPLSELAAVVDSMRLIREGRHGVPFVVQTSGLYGGAEELAELDQEFKADPGSDGLSKLQVWVELAAASPPAYEKVAQPQLPGPAAFGQACGAISTLAESGVAAYATASKNPAAGDLKHVSGLAAALGAAGLFERTYHPDTLYERLGVPEGAGGAEIKAAYKSRAKELHPDVNPGAPAGAMEEVAEAYAVLGDEGRRRMCVPTRSAARARARKKHLRQKRASEGAGGGARERSECEPRGSLSRQKRARGGWRGHERSECEGGALPRQKRASEGVVGGRPPEPPPRPARLHARSVARARARLHARALGCTRAPPTDSSCLLASLAGTTRSTLRS
jgi:hypothetical protein